LSTNPNPNNNTNNNNPNNQTNNQNNQTQDGNDLWSENLRKNEEQRRKDSKWFNMQPGDKTVLKFLPQFGPDWKDFDNDGIKEKLVYEYNVIDLNNQDVGPIPWDVSKTWSEEIDYHLKQGHYVMKVERVGSGKKTKYHFTPVDGASTLAVNNTTTPAS